MRPGCASGLSPSAHTASCPERAHGQLPPNARVADCPRTRSRPAAPERARGQLPPNARITELFR